MTTTTDPTAVVDAIARSLAAPHQPPEDQPWQTQSMAVGAAGTALFHIERARTGRGTWRQAHTWITAAVSTDVIAADTTGLYLGVPAIGFMLLCAVTDDSTRYHQTLNAMDRHVADLAHRRVDSADNRLRSGRHSTFHEYDVFYGLTGIGSYLLRSAPSGTAMERILTYLVALTRPVRDADHELPGWWVGHAPDLTTSDDFPGGHANLGAAHGITGPLMLLSLAHRQGVTVDGQAEAIATIVGWLDEWRQDGPSGPWWPEHITIAELRAGRTRRTGPARPSWCYGTPGIARAGQLSSIALGDARLQHQFEHDMARCLTDPAQLNRLTDGGLCHGWAGVYQTAWRAARDAATPALRDALPGLAAALTLHAHPGPDPGLLQGNAGTALALTTAAHDAAPTSGWDACLLID
ncbi:lanthionine synthetase C family protein [Streptomyces sp. NPDC048506]|uniref:lanthionine synthetase C family protein n=1 Tax=Streptomyces sp. NPDC048506 TaxID=3155028 RepID=UPI00344388E8